ncbi:radical SAM protein [bacterium]|nr:radical SAM protein [bacterium]
MKIQELARNLIETNNICSAIYDFICSKKIYKIFINKKIQNRLQYNNSHKNMKFMIETTSVCNAKCVFCPYTKMERQHFPMSDEIFNKIITRIKEENINPVLFDLFFIGEPFLDKKIFERIKILKLNFPNTPINITSNFNTCNEEIINKIIEADINLINISLNAVDEEKYKTTMGLDYKKTVKNIKNLIKAKKKQKNKLKINLSMVLYDENKFSDVIKFFFYWVFKVESLRFQRAVTWANKVEVKNFISKSRKKLYPCNDLFERIPILSNGDFALCCQDSEGMIKRNILDTKIMEAWNSEVYSKIRKIHLNEDLKNFDLCKDCFGTNSNGANWIFIDR